MSFDIWEPDRLDAGFSRAAATAALDRQAFLKQRSSLAIAFEAVFHPHLPEGMFSFPIDVARDWLGRSYFTSIAGRWAEIRLPRLDPDPESYALREPVFVRPPSDWSDWVFPSQPHHPKWGYQQPGGRSASGYRVRDLGLLVYLRQPEDPAQVALEVQDALGRWWACVADWIELLSSQDLRGGGNDGMPGASITSWSVADGHILPGRSFWLRRPVFRLGQEASNALEHAFHAAGLDHEPPLEWQTIREAIAAFQRDHYRRTVIESGMALEYGLQRLLKRTRIHAEPESFTLGKLVKMEREGATSSMKPSTLPGEVEHLVVEARNNAVHRGWSPSAADAARAVQTTLTALDAILPRSGFMYTHGISLPND